MTGSLYSPRFSYILRVSPTRGFGFTSWILPYLYTIDLHLGISNPLDNKTCVHLGDQTCHQWYRKNDSERFHVLAHLLRNQIGRPGGSLELDLSPLAELDPKLFRKLINVVFFVVQSWLPGKSNSSIAKRDYILLKISVLIFPSLYVI